MADETTSPSDNPKGSKESAATPASPPQQFRVLHAAVSGVVPDPKNPGRTKEHDFYAGAIVTDEQLAGQASQYLVQRAIEPVDAS